MGGLSLPQILRAEDSAGVGSSNKAVIMVYLPGGPSHTDMWDIKEEAPSQIRGEFNAISTSVPGIRICEHLPQIARQMDYFVPIRSISDSFGQHSSYQTLTGHSNKPIEPAGGWPEFGAVLDKFQGQSPEGVPSAVGLSASRTGALCDSSKMVESRCAGGWPQHLGSAASGGARPEAGSRTPPAHPTVARGAGGPQNRV